MSLSITEPFFIFNPKSYLYGEDLIKFAQLGEKLTEKYSLPIFVTVPFADISSVSKVTDQVIVTAQHMDGIEPGRGMGHVLPESIVNAGARATFINHAERSLTLAEVAKAVKRAKELDILTIVCADSIYEARAIAQLSPDIILCEPTELIGTGQTSDEAYVTKTNQAIKEVNSDILIMQGAGISTPEDVYNVIKLGADGTGCTSGITEAEDPLKMFEDMVEAVYQAKRESE